jgi:hypothetical protein
MPYHPNKWTLACLSLALIPTLLVAQDTPTAHRFNVVQEGDVGVAVNTGGPKYKGELFRYEKVLELAQDPQVPESLLQAPTVPFLSSSEEYFVPDPRQSRIVVFGPDGKYRHSIGRRGSGPGDFNLAGIKRIVGDTVYAFDPTLDRVTLFHTDGTLIDVWSPPLERMGNVSDIMTVPNGSTILLSIVSSYAEPDGEILDPQTVKKYEADGFSWQSARATILDSEGSVLAVAESQQAPVSFYAGAGAYEIRWGQLYYSAWPTALYVPGKGILITSGARPELTWYARDGSITQRVEVGISPDPITREDRRRLEAVYNQRIEEASGAMQKEAARFWRNSLRFLETRGYWDSALVDDRGYIWLRIPETTEDRREAGGSAYHVLSPQGEHLGKTRTPATRGNVAQGRFLAVLTDPDTDERIPTIFRIHTVPEGFTYRGGS